MCNPYVARWSGGSGEVALMTPQHMRPPTMNAVPPNIFRSENSRVRQVSP